MSWNLKKIEIELDSIIENKTKNYINGNIKDFRFELNKSVILKNNTDITINFVYLTINDKTTNFKDKVRLTCKLKENNETVVNMKDIKKFHQLYGGFVLQNYKAKTSYFIIFKPEIKKEDTIDYIYNKINNIYSQRPHNNIGAIIGGSNFKILKKLYDLLSYYGYDNPDHKPIKGNTLKKEDINEFTDLLFYYIYDILFKENAELLTDEEYEYYSKRIVKRYKEFL